MKFSDVKFPVYIEEGVSMTPNQGRFILRDNSEQRVGVFFDMPPNVAHFIVRAMNTSHTANSQKAPAPAWKAPEAVSFPSWMGEFPRRGSAWTSAETALLINAYKNGMDSAAFAKVVGRDVSGVEYRLLKELGQGYNELFGQLPPKQEEKPLDAFVEFAEFVELLATIFGKKRS